MTVEKATAVTRLCFLAKAALTNEKASDIALELIQG